MSTPRAMEGTEALPILSKKQRIVRHGIMTGVLTGAAVALLTYALLPSGPETATFEVRLGFALRCCLVASLTLVAGIMVVAAKRYSSDAIDPTAGAESRALKIHMRYVQNTLEQLTLFVVASTTLSSLMTGHELKALAAATIVFVLGRIFFWVGYLKDPLLRIPGFNATLYTNIGLTIYSLLKLGSRLF